jgi:MoaA/NifB/PqqE/SkfB family radical SAM enzyme
VGGHTATTGELGEPNIAWLLSQELIAPGVPPTAEARVPFAFVRAINLELSYSCNLACSHCLQTPLRPQGAATWLPLELVQHLLLQAQELDLLRAGLNITGGETFTAGSPLLAILALASNSGIHTRANTNAWWGLKQDIRIGDGVFADDEAVVVHLQRLGLDRLALSLDGRYAQYPQLLERVIRVASLCERHELVYEFVATDVDPELLSEVQDRIEAAHGGLLLHVQLTLMDTVDIGAAAPNQRRALHSNNLAALARSSPCGTTGFHRPYYLHVSPDGGVRSCLYAPGGGWHGNLHDQSLRSILNSAASNPVLQLFERGELDAFVAQYLNPWRQLYRQVEHGCGAAALIARLAERLTALSIASDGHPAPEAMEALHRRLAAEMGLAAVTQPIAP